MIRVLKVSAASDPISVAGAISSQLRERSNAEIQAIGAAAVNQAVKAIAISTASIKTKMEREVVAVIDFIDVMVDHDRRMTAIRFLLRI